MKFINPTIHAILDYLVVILFWAAAYYYSDVNTAGGVMFLYAIGAVHLVLTLATNFPGGIFKIIPLCIHGWIELAVGLSFVSLPWVLKSKEIINHGDLCVIVAFGVLILVTWAFSDYKKAAV